MTPDRVIKNLDKDTTFLTTGASLQALFGEEGKVPFEIRSSIHSLPLWGMKWKEIQGGQISNFEEAISVEDHLADAGFESFLLESLSSFKSNKHKLTIKALDTKVCGMVGSQKTLWSLSKLST